MDEYAQKIQWALEEDSDVDQEILKIVAERTRRENEKVKDEEEAPF